MGWFSKIFSSGVSSVVDSIGNAIDKIHTSDEEKLKLKNELAEQMNDLEKATQGHVERLESEITARHTNDMKSDSWLSKNVRPIMLIVLTVAMIGLMFSSVFTPLAATQITALQSWIPLLQALLITVYSFYFGGRTLEKVKNVAIDFKKGKN